MEYSLLSWSMGYGDASEPLCKSGSIPQSHPTGNFPNGMLPQTLTTAFYPLKMGGTYPEFFGKKIKGCQLDILLDTPGLLMTVVVHSASLQDIDGAKSVFLKVKDDLPTLKIVSAHQGY